MPSLRITLTPSIPQYYCEERGDSCNSYADLFNRKPPLPPAYSVLRCCQGRIYCKVEFASSPVCDIVTQTAWYDYEPTPLSCFTVHSRVKVQQTAGGRSKGLVGMKYR